MTLAQLRTLWRRYVHDVPAVAWDNTEANAILNVAYAIVQTYITTMDPEAHIFWDYIQSQAGVNWYPLPTSFAPIEVSIKPTSAATSYTMLEGPKDYQQVKSVVADSGPFWALRGQWIGVFPAPTETIAQGIELVHNPVMQLSGDTDIPRIKIPLHDLIAIEGALMALGETDGEATDWLKERKAERLAALPLWYNPRLTPERLQVEGA